MGQKINPVCFRLGAVHEWKSRWFADSKNYSECLLNDLRIREYIENKLQNAAISDIEIDRPAKNVRITVKTARAGKIIGKHGGGVDELKNEIKQLVGVPVDVNIEEVRKPEIDAKLVSQNIAQQLERRVMFRRAMKRAVKNALRAGAEGIRVSVSGRLGGSEIARTEWYREGRIPLHTIRADIDFYQTDAYTPYGVIGVKVWTFKGEKMKKRQPVQTRANS
jgi:small subunit ribosomal protein S3